MPFFGGELEGLGFRVLGFRVLGFRVCFRAGPLKGGHKGLYRDN